MKEYIATKKKSVSAAIFRYLPAGSQVGLYLQLGIQRNQAAEKITDRTIRTTICQRRVQCPWLSPGKKDGRCPFYAKSSGGIAIR